jgi:hypothetical protein
MIPGTLPRHYQLVSGHLTLVCLVPQQCFNHRLTSAYTLFAISHAEIAPVLSPKMYSFRCSHKCQQVARIVVRHIAIPGCTLRVYPVVSFLKNFESSDKSGLISWMPNCDWIIAHTSIARGHKKNRCNVDSVGQLLHMIQPLFKFLIPLRTRTYFVRILSYSIV